jgi:TonB family protein
MRITLITFILLVLPFTAFLQKTGTLVLSGDAVYYGYDMRQFVVYYNDEMLGFFDKGGRFNLSEDIKTPLTIKHPDFEVLVVEKLKFSKKYSEQNLFEHILPEAEKRFEDKLKEEQVTTCTGSKKEDLLKDTILEIDTPARFPGDEAGGRAAFSKFIGEHFEYPQRSLEHGMQGKVYLSFIVEADGSITCIEIKKGVDYFMDKEAFRLVKSFPKFIPATSKGVAVPTVYTFPLNFVLQ